MRPGHPLPLALLPPLRRSYTLARPLGFVPPFRLAHIAFACSPHILNCIGAPSKALPFSLTSHLSLLSPVKCAPPSPSHFPCTRLVHVTARIIRLTHVRSSHSVHPSFTPLHVQVAPKGSLRPRREIKGAASRCAPLSGHLSHAADSFIKGGRVPRVRMPLAFHAELVVLSCPPCAYASWLPPSGKAKQSYVS